MSAKASHMPSELCDEITYTFLIFTGCTSEAWEMIGMDFFSCIINGVITMLGFKLIHLS